MNMSGLAGLSSLDVSSNGLHKIPTSLCEMPNLTALDIYNNRLTALPLEFAALYPRLKTSSLGRNPFTLLPEKWCHDWTSKIQHTIMWTGGYTDGQAADWATELSVWYDAAKGEYEDSADQYFSGEASRESYVEVRHILLVRMYAARG